jgi:hypothetical protein
MKADTFCLKNNCFSLFEKKIKLKPGSNKTKQKQKKTTEKPCNVFGDLIKFHG